MNTMLSQAKNLTTQVLSIIKGTLYASFNLYSTYYRVEFFSIDNTDVDVPDSVLKAPVGSISLP